MSDVRASLEMRRRIADVEAISRRFRAALDVSGLRQAQLAASSGVQPTTVNNWVKALKRPSPDEAAAILPVLGITLDWLLLGDDRALPWELRNKLLEALDRTPPSAANSAALARRKRNDPA